MNNSASPRKDTRAARDMGCGSSAPKDGLPEEPVKKKSDAVEPPPPAPPAPSEAHSQPETNSDAPPVDNVENEDQEEEEEEEEPLWPADRDPYVDGRLYGLQPKPGVPKPGMPFKAVLSVRNSYGSGEGSDGDAPLGPVMPFCPYCARLGIMMREAGLDFETVLIDSYDKPKWFLEALPAGQTPAILGPPGGDDSGSWVEGTDNILANLRKDPTFAAWFDRPCVVPEAEIKAKISKAAFACIAAFIAESKTGLGVMKFMSGAGGFDLPEDEDGKDRRERCNAIVKEGVLELESIIGGLEGDFLGGDEPGSADVTLCTMLFTWHNGLNAGMSGFGEPRSFESLGAPSLEPYLERWVRRKSFGECYMHSNLYNANQVASMMGMFEKATADATDPDTVLRAVMDKARSLDPLYDGVDRLSSAA